MNQQKRRRWGGLEDQVLSTNVQVSSTHAGVRAPANVKAICAVVFLIGAGLVFTVGFAPTSEIHNAAHDTRHGLAFPCH